MTLLIKLTILKNHLLPYSRCIFYTFLIVLVVGCGGPSSTPAGGSSTTSTSSSIDNGVVKFKLDGADWISDSPGHPELKYEEEATTDGNTVVRIEAFAEDGSYLALTIYKTSGIGPGTFPITDTGMSAFYKKDFNEGGGYVTSGMKDNPGSITITSMTKEKVVGTFNFAIRSSGDPEDVRQVTAGSFDLNFTYY